MSNKRRNRRTAKSTRNRVLGRARAKTRLAANVTEEQDWYLDTPDVRLTRIFAVVLVLHAVAIGGIMAFKMVDKASATTGITISSARTAFEEAVEEQKALASEVPAVARPEDSARPMPPSPLRRDRTAENQYKVQAGDTLPEIAKSLGVSSASLKKANSIISDNELYPGRWLHIPDKKAQVKSGAEKKSPASDPPAAQRPAIYEVKQGDTAWGISRELNVSFNELMQLNGIKRPETLQIGQELRVPQVR
ncbi:MAG: LysM peptidoglycan-binding domain-containing protein [Verrucomicrobiota bacterium]